jgi:hypothetical protein
VPIDLFEERAPASRRSTSLSGSAFELMRAARQVRCNAVGGYKVKEVSMADRVTPTNWDAEDAYWKTNYKNRPYASTADREYEFYQPGYRYGVDSAARYEGRVWEDARNELERDWDRYEHRGQSTWEQVKDAVRDAWDRVTGKTSVGSR